MQPLLFKGYRKPLEQEDLEDWPICQQDCAKPGRDELEGYWADELKKAKYFPAARVDWR